MYVKVWLMKPYRILSYIGQIRELSSIGRDACAACRKFGVNPPKNRSVRERGATRPSGDITPASQDIGCFAHRSAWKPVGNSEPAKVTNSIRFLAEAMRQGSRMAASQR